jgi:hypothetical protein
MMLPNKVAGANRRWRWLFRCRSSVSALFPCPFLACAVYLR